MWWPGVGAVVRSVLVWLAVLVSGAWASESADPPDWRDEPPVVAALNRYAEFFIGRRDFTGPRDTRQWAEVESLFQQSTQLYEQMITLVHAPDWFTCWLHADALEGTCQDGLDAIRDAERETGERPPVSVAPAAAAGRGPHAPPVPVAAWSVWALVWWAACAVAGVFSVVSVWVCGSGQPASNHFDRLRRSFRSAMRWAWS